MDDEESSEYLDSNSKRFATKSSRSRIETDSDHFHLSPSNICSPTNSSTNECCSDLVSNNRLNQQFNQMYQSNPIVPLYRSESLLSSTLFQNVDLDLSLLNLMQHSWFFQIDRKTSEQLLLQECNPNGSFLVRPSLTYQMDHFILSVLYRDRLVQSNQNELN